MLKDSGKLMRLGVFVLAGTLFLIIAMYFIGAKQSLFTSTFRITANFRNVDGLMKGNNIRFAGIDVGTVDDIEIINDSCVKVTMLIEEDSRAHIKKNALASIGTDGLMGNKLVNISPADEPGVSIEDGDVLETVRAIETEAMLRTLNKTNDEIYTIAHNLRIITERVNNANTLWSLLSDTAMAENVKNAIVSIKLTGARSATITGDLSDIIKHVKSGKGTLGSLIVDTTLAHRINQTIVKVQLVSDTLAYISGDLKYITGHVRSGQGAVGTVLMDTTFVNNLNQSMKEIRSGSQGLSENMEALKSSIFLRRYFRKKAKQSN